MINRPLISTSLLTLQVAKTYWSECTVLIVCLIIYVPVTVWLISVPMLEHTS